MANVYEIITQNIIQKLKEGTAPWRKPWNAAISAPRNFVTGRRYTGINVLLLVMEGYRSPHWLTFEQVKTKGGEVRKGEKHTKIVFFRMLKKTEVDADGNEVTRHIPMLRYYRVFNVEQTTLEVPDLETYEVNPVGAAEEIVSGYKDAPPIREIGAKAYYLPFEDTITVPPRESFPDTRYFYSVLFHEMGHSTGHESRLDRHARKNFHFGSHDYGREELVAEMTTAFLAAEAGLEVTQDVSASYLDHWINVISEDSHAVITAAAAAQKAADHILGRTEEEEGGE